MDFNARYDKLHRIMRRAGLDAVALIPGPNHRYLTGAEHYVLERPIVTFYAADREPLAVIPELEIPLFQRHPKPAEIVSYTDAEGYAGAFETALNLIDSRGKTIGVEGLFMRFFEGEIIRQSAPEARVIDATEPLAELRMHKDAGEVALLRRAIAISERALQAMFDEVTVGMSEIEAAAILEAHIKDLGGDGLSFGTILHAGVNTPLPHSGPLDYRIQHGDPLIVDFGATLQGLLRRYHARGLRRRGQRRAARLLRNRASGERSRSGGGAAWRHLRIGGYGGAAGLHRRRLRSI